jgi:riboflavin synthase
MFTGIITDIGTIESAEQRGDMRLTIRTAYDMASVDMGASIACSGVCLTVVDKGADDRGNWFAVDVSGETISCVAANMFTPETKLNLERALKVGDELGGHIVTGHVDGVGTIESVDAVGGSHHIVISMPDSIAPFVAAKGSITVDGISLTVNSVEDAQKSSSFTLNIIPHTAEMTNAHLWAAGQQVNLEIDVLARYLQRMQAHMAK